MCKIKSGYTIQLQKSEQENRRKKYEMNKKVRLSKA
jgi:hypothetical protein